MYVSTLTQAHLGARPVGMFAGMGVMGAMIGSGRTAGWNAGAGPAGMNLGGPAVSRVLPEQQGVAACGAASKATGGKDGAEPFYMEGCGCGGVCGAGCRCGGDCATVSRTDPHSHPADRTAVSADMVHPAEWSQQMEGRSAFWEWNDVLEGADLVIDCTDEQKAKWNRIVSCLRSGFAEGPSDFGYLLAGLSDWCLYNIKRPDHFLWGVTPGHDAVYGVSHCDCAHTKWLLGDPSKWPKSLRSDMEAVCRYTSGIMNEPLFSFHPDGYALQMCAYFDWSLLDFDHMTVDGSDCGVTWDGSEGGPCERVLWGDPEGDSKCGPSAGGSVTTGPTGPLIDHEMLLAASCNCWGVSDFGGSCLCGAASVSCTPSGAKCLCTGTCDQTGAFCSRGYGKFSMLVDSCDRV